MLKAGWQPHTASPVWHNRVSRDPSELQRALHLPQSFGILPSHCLFPPFVSISLHKHRIPFSSTKLLRQLPGWRWKKPTLQGLERCQLPSAEQCATRYDHSSRVWASSCQSTRTRLSLTCMCSNQGGQYLMSTPTSDTSPVFCWDQEPYHALQLTLPTLPRGETEYMPICSTHSKQAQEKVKSWWLTCYLQCFLLHTSFFLSSSFVQIGMKLRHKESLIISWTWKNACLSSPTPARFDDLTEHQPKAKAKPLQQLFLHLMTLTSFWGVQGGWQIFSSPDIVNTAFCCTWTHMETAGEKLATGWKTSLVQLLLIGKES